MMYKIVNILFSDCDFSYSVFYFNEPELICNKDYEVIGYHPFAISYCKNDKWLFGSAAIEYSKNNFGSTIFSFDDLLEEHNKIVLNGEIFSPLKILVLLFEQISSNAKDCLGQEEVYGYTITLPNDYDLFQKQFIEKAVYTASLPLKRFYKYTDCLAGAYEFFRPSLDGGMTCAIYLDYKSIHIGVYDIEDGVIESFATTSIKNFNTKLLVDKLILYCLSEYKKKEFKNYNIDFVYLKLRCEAILKEVEDSKQVSVFVYDISDKEKSIYVNFTPEKIQYILKEQFDELFTQIDIMIKNIVIDGLNDKYNANDIENVIVDTGGIFNSYLVHILKNKFSCPVMKMNHYVRKGGAIYSGILTGDTKDILLLESFSSNISIVLKNGGKCVLIEKNSTIPSRRGQNFKVKPLGDKIEIPVFSDDKFIGGCVITNNTKEDKMYEIEVIIDIDVNCNITLEANIIGMERKKIFLPLDNLSIPRDTHITSKLEYI